MDFQYKKRVEAELFVDLETGDTSEIPDLWGNDDIQKVLWWSQQNGSPLTVDRRVISKMMWTTIIGDLIVFDRPSPYETFTYTPFFPYFRRGVTRGMVEDLLDPQMEINKRRSARVDTQMRVAHSGWKYHTNSMTPEQKMRLRLFGSEPGFDLEWQGDPAMEPKKIEASAPAMGLRELEEAGTNDLREISGINEATLGEINAGQSGRALEARQRQSVIGVQYYFTNYSRTKDLLGRKDLEVVQKHYTEPRIIRVLGSDNKVGPAMMINERVASDGQTAAKIRNNVTLGKYRVVVSETPLAASFQAAQFDEMMMILEKLGPLGQKLAATNPGLIIRNSSLPDKDEWEKGFEDAMKSPHPDPVAAEVELKHAQAFSAAGTGAMNFAKAQETFAQAMANLQALEAMFAGAPGAQPPGPGGAPSSPAGPPQGGAGGPPPPSPNPISGVAGLPSNIVPMTRQPGA